MRRVAGALALLVVSQVILWTGLALAERVARPAGVAYTPAIDAWPADNDGRIVSGSTPTRIALQPEPAYVLEQTVKTPRVLFEHRFAATPGEERSLYLAWGRRIMDVHVNGQRLTARTPTELWGILGGFDPVLYTIPGDLLRPTDNRLAVTASGGTRKVMPAFFIGDPAALARAHAWGRIFSIDLVIAATGVLAFVLLLTLIIDWPPPDRARIRMLSLLLAAWALRNLTILDVDSAIPDPWRLFFHFVVTFAFLCALLAFAAGWTGRSRAWARAASGVFVLSVAASLAALAHSTGMLWNIAFDIETALSIGIGLVVTGLFVTHAARGSGRPRAETVLFLICTGVIMVDAIDDRFQITVPFIDDLPLTFYAAPMCGLLLALGTVASLAAESTRARRAVLSINQTLEERLAEREREIRANYERQAEFERDQALANERQRIVRDMHDGLGGQLVSLLMRARNGSIDNDELTAALQSSLEDLRLIVHSMYNVGDSLGTALGTFRSKIEPQLEAAGIELDWQMAIDDATPGFGPHAVLQIYRILQEACTNAICHAGANRLRIAAVHDVNKGLLRVTVSDNGDGSDRGHNGTGHGVENMRARAEGLGGSLSLRHRGGGRGTVVTLEVPLRATSGAVASAAS